MPAEPPNFLTNPGVPELPEHASEPTVLSLHTKVDHVPTQAQPVYQEEPESPREKRHIKRWIALVIFAVILFLVAPLVYGGGRALLAARSFQKTFDVTRVDIEAGDFEGAAASFDALQESLRDMKRGVQQTGNWRYMPWVGPRLTSVERIAVAGEGTIDAVKDLVEVGNQLREAGLSFSSVEHGVEPHRSFEDLTVDERRSILSRLDRSLVNLRVAREKIQLALQSWDQVDASLFPESVRTMLEKSVVQLHAFDKSLDQSTSLLDVFIPLAGYPSEKSYLVLLQNPDEQRPAGGFIGVIGQLKVDAGNIEQFSFGDVYSQDAPLDKRWTDEAPYPMKRWLGVNSWYVRDGNWSPDFPTSAEQVLSMYKRAYNIRTGGTIDFDGVIALEPGIFRSLLDITGPITIEDKTFTSENFFDLLEYDVERGFNEKGIPVAQRKDIVARVGDVLMNRLKTLPASRWPEVLNVVSKALGEKDVLMYARDPQLLARLDRHQWTGRVKPSAGDYLWVVDANLAGLKTDGVMQKDIMYSVDPTRPDGAIATVRLRYKNTNTAFTWRYSRYRNYVRVFVPEGSELISTEGSMADDKTKTGGVIVPGVVDVGRDLGKTYFGTFWSIEPGETRDLVFTYRLPPVIQESWKAGSYELVVQRQPGTRARLTVDHAFGKNIKRATPGEDPKDYGDMSYRVLLPLIKDEVMEVGF